MANILIVYFSECAEAMYDAISDKLIEHGNSVFRLNINSPDIENSKWGGDSKIINGNLIKKIKKFSPNIVFNFNNCLPKNIYEYLVRHSVVCLIDADAPLEAFWNKNEALTFCKKVKFLGLQSCSKTMYEQFLNCKLDDNQYLYFPPATIVNKHSMPKKVNIAFIGSNFWPLAIPIDPYFYSKDGLDLASHFKNDYLLKFSDAQKMYKCTYEQFTETRIYYAGQYRLFALKVLSDLGLKIYGQKSWYRVAFYDFDIARCYDKTKITTIKENENLYNQSKVSVNISHPLAKTSFSWRVMDIMASDSCLLMEQKKDWFDLFAEYLSKETIDSIIYKDFYDMRQKAITLLQNDALREGCIKDLNNAIEQNGRWEKRFSSLEKFININILRQKNDKQIYINTIDMNGTEQQTKKYIENGFLSRLRFKSRIKIIIACCILAFAQIPVLGKPFKRISIKKKLVSKIGSSF